MPRRHQREDARTVKTRRHVPQRRELPPSWDTPRVGDVRWGSIYKPGDAFSQGKLRPVVLVRSADDGWLVAAMTTHTHYRHGAPRVPVPNPTACGLGPGGHLWDGPLIYLPHRDVRSRIGRVHEALAWAIAQTVDGVTVADVKAMLAGDTQAPGSKRER